MPSIVWSAVAAFALCAGCTGQLTSSGTVDAGESGSDGRGSSAPSPDGPLATADGAAGFTCRTGTTSYSSGHHNPGQDCNGSCHDHGFTLAGTLFTTATGSTPVAGATITVVDANSHSIDLITQQNGNFYTSTSIAFPVTLYASACPTVQMMTAPMTQGTGGCNQTGCHTAAATGRIHLP